MQRVETGQLQHESGADRVCLPTLVEANTKSKQARSQRWLSAASCLYRDGVIQLNPWLGWMR